MSGLLDVAAVSAATPMTLGIVQKIKPIIEACHPHIQWQQFVIPVRLQATYTLTTFNHPNHLLM
ncbi:hypothetical protein ykris0001_7650 [Yersinia kristensenii ATCC 33638]|nr:hypothetical protein ykris0001_7650 [Yersinia kristensenii ATCC 33638]